MAATAAATALYLLLVPVGGQAPGTVNPRMNQLSPPISQEDCQSRIAHMTLPNTECVPVGSGDTTRIFSDITPVAHHAAAPMALLGK